MSFHFQKDCVMRFATFAIAFSTVALSGCVSRSYNTPSALEPQEGQYIFVAMPDATYGGAGSVADPAAGMVSGLRRFALRSAGLFVPEAPEQNGVLMALDNLDGSTLFTRTCDSSGNCSFSVRDKNGGGPRCDVKAKRDDVEVYLPCIVANANAMGVGAPAIGVAILNRAAIGAKFSGSRVKPNTNLESFRTGPFFRGDDQSLLRVAEGTSIQFEVDEKLAASPVFQKAYAIAANYWNTAAGREVLSPVLRSTNDFRFGFFRSLIRLNSKSGGTLARANSLADAVTGTILSMRVDIFEIPETDVSSPTAPSFSGTLTHELGHALGMAHNFAASFDDMNSAEVPTTSVMDYMIDDGDLRKPHAYDVEFMRYVYQGEKPSGQRIHCNDVQTSYITYCTRYDVTKQTPEMLLARLKDFSTLTQDSLSKYGEALNGLMPREGLGKLLIAAQQKNPQAIAMLITTAPSLAVSAIKELSFNANLTTVLRDELVKGLALRMEHIITNGKGLSLEQVAWLRWLVEYSRAPFFNHQNRIELMKALDGFERGGFQLPHGPDLG
jgi:hypothetical protein